MVADLIERCLGDAPQRPDAQECAETLAQFVPGIGARRMSSRSLSGSTPRAVLQGPPSARTASGDATASGEASPLALASSRRSASSSLTGEVARPEAIPEGDPQPQQPGAEEKQTAGGEQAVKGTGV